MDSIFAYSSGHAPGQLHKKQLLNVVDDLHCFILQVVNMRRKFFHEAREFAMKDKYIGLCECHNQEHRAPSTSDPRE